MEWQAVVFALQILLLAVSWGLFQRARAELSARVAEAPILNEMKTLQRNVKQLLVDLEGTTERTSERLEARCAEARTALAALESRLETIPTSPTPLLSAEATISAPRTRRAPSSKTTARLLEKPTTEEVAVVALTTQESAPRMIDRQAIFQRADAGETASQIAQATGLAEGEVETVLSLRPRPARRAKSRT